MCVSCECVCQFFVCMCVRVSARVSVYESKGYNSISFCFFFFLNLQIILVAKTYYCSCQKTNYFKKNFLNLWISRIYFFFFFLKVSLLKSAIIFFYLKIFFLGLLFIETEIFLFVSGKNIMMKRFQSYIFFFSSSGLLEI